MKILAVPAFFSGQKELNALQTVSLIKCGVSEINIDCLVCGYFFLGIKHQLLHYHQEAHAF